MASSACAIQVHHCSIKKAQQMNEILRQEYLHTLGIQSYYPRKKLAGAPLSTVMLTPESEAQVKPASRDEKAPSLVQTRAALQDKKQSKSDDDKAGLSARSTQPIAEARFQLAFIRVSASILVMILLPHTGDRNSLNPAQRKLFINICRALKIPEQDLDFSIKVFRWPFSEAAHLDKSAAAAQAALFTYLAQLQEDHKITQFLFMGSSITELVSAAVDSDLHICRSLDEMLKMPALKRETWQVLRQLASGD